MEEYFKKQIDAEEKDFSTLFYMVQEGTKIPNITVSVLRLNWRRGQKINLPENLVYDRMAGNFPLFKVKP
jgi:hypothetical protein